MPNGTRQRLVREWPGEEVERASLHGHHGRPHIGKTGHEDDRQLRFSAEQSLEFQSVEVRQCSVENQATGYSGTRSAQKLRRGRENLCLPALTSDQKFERLPHRAVVINDEDNGGTTRAVHALFGVSACRKLLHIFTLGLTPSLTGWRRLIARVARSPNGSQLDWGATVLGVVSRKAAALIG